MSDAQSDLRPGLSTIAQDTLAHRREIDGLRAIAVLAVVLYHFGLPGFGGGFVGVDIFFVISGFLIGGILWREISLTGTISLSRFFSRRIRRLAPAYVVMAVVVFLVCYAVLLPFEFRDFGKSLISSTVYLSNVYFFREAGYFDSAAHDKILLHTWSLSLEEQFYIFLPAVMLLLRSRRKLLLAAVALMFAVSVALCIVATPISHTAAFYLFPFRAWELLAGVLLAIYGYERSEQWRHSGLVSLAGLVLIVGSIVFLQAGPSFPGVQALLPVIGTVLIILNGRQDNVVNRLLSSHPAVFIGLISYSLYLWHWPVITLSRYYRDGATETAFDIALWLTVSFVLAWFSWRFVERPFRKGFAMPPVRVFAGMAVSLLVLLAAGGLVYRGNGMPDRFDPSVRMHIDASADFIQDWSRCSVSTDGPFSGIETCAMGPEGPPKFVIWGDSHARAFKEGLQLLAQEKNRPGLLIWRAGCPPLFGVEKQESATTRQQDQDCSVANGRIREAIADLQGVEKILLIGRWSYYAEGGGIGYDAINTIKLRPSPDTGDGSVAQSQVFADAVEATADELAKRFEHVYVLRQVPEVPLYDSRDVARRLVHKRDGAGDGESARFGVASSAVAARTASSEQPFADLAARGTIEWLDPRDLFCSGDTCSAVRDGRSYYFDNNHVTNSAALALRNIFDPLMEGTVQTARQVSHDDKQ